jgi:GNAT superfamily N-acetyltransferase
MSLTFRPAGLADSFTAFKIFGQAVADLVRRLNLSAVAEGDDPAVLAGFWQKRQSLFEHLARTADQFWLAEDGGEAIGYARSILRDGVRELTEFFVLPDRQSAGVGRALLDRALPPDEAARRVIIATSDARALARYLKAGVYARFPVYYFSRPPEQVAVPTDLVIEPITAPAQAIETLAAIDQAVLGHRREVDHTWLLDQNQGYLYYREGQPVGYGYSGASHGPFALLHPADFPAVLAHAESLAAAAGHDFGVEAPLINRAAVDYLLSRGCRMEAFFAFFMSDAPFGRFENYLFTSPPFFM